MKVEKFKVLLYLKKSGLDKSGRCLRIANRTLSDLSVSIVGHI
ncbi:hypothetical protein [Culturomica massiliensis]|nr:hypothetical protein [Culturomica massiliensis]